MLEGATAASAKMDQVRWEEQYVENGYSGDRITQIDFLKNYIAQRKDFLDQVWIEQTPVHQITLLIEGTVYDTLYVLDGDTLPEFPQILEEHAQVTGWTSIKDGSTPDQSTPVITDMTFQAILSPQDVTTVSGQKP